MMLTRRKLLMGLAAGVAAATAAATLVRTAAAPNVLQAAFERKQWYPTAYHNAVVSDPNSSWRVTKYPGNYDIAHRVDLTNDTWWFGRQNGKPRT